MTEEKKRLNAKQFRSLLSKIEYGQRVRIKAGRLAATGQSEMIKLLQYGMLVPDPRFCRFESMKDKEDVLTGKYLLADMVYIKCQPHSLEPR